MSTQEITKGNLEVLHEALGDEISTYLKLMS